MTEQKSPQLENEYASIENEILDAIMRVNLAAYQTRLLFAVWRKTYGEHKPEFNISVSQFEKMTGIAKGHICRTLKELEIRRIIKRKGSIIAFNKHYNEWDSLPSGVRPYRKLPNGVTTVTHSGLKVTQRGNKSLLNGVTKDVFFSQIITSYNLSQEQIDEAKEILQSINKKAGKHLPEHYTGIYTICDRLIEGHLREEFEQIIDTKLEDPNFSNNYMRPETLFKKENFDKYLNENPDDYIIKKKIKKKPMMTHGKGYYHKKPDIEED